MRISVDVGGTFTDVVLLNEADNELRFEKVDTVPGNPAEGVLRGFDKAGLDYGSCTAFVHGTTLGLNALLTGGGVRTAIVTTRGFRDVYILGRTSRDALYDFKHRKPEPLVPRRYTYEVMERLDYMGDVLTPFDTADARRVAQEIREAGVEAVAICFLHAYVNPVHEILMEEVLREVCPDVSISVSHKLVREHREYERTSTVVIDAYIKPIVRGYLETLDAALVEKGFGGNFLLTRSGGGALTARAAKEAPVHLILSGPAGGVVGAAGFGKLINTPNLITIDMGGTSLDASLVVNGEASTDTQQSFHSFPLSIPTLRIHTVGTGGGSIAWVDDGGHLQVGPKSAGAMPGPAAYGKGGEQATFTDAALVIGYLDPNNFVGGEAVLDLSLAEAAIGRLADQLGLSVLQTAAGIVRISIAKIVGAVREISIEKGYDPRDFSLLAFGGGGPFVASHVARELEMQAAIIPPGSSNFSALGMLMVDVMHDLSRTRLTSLDGLDRDAVNAIYAELVEEASHFLEMDGVAPEDRRLLPMVDLRYVGQEHAVTVPLPGCALAAGDDALIRDRFNDAHLRLYGHKMEQPVEIVTMRLRAVGLLPHPALPRNPEADGDAALSEIGTRIVIDPYSGEEAEYRIYRFGDLVPHGVIPGPAIVENVATTIVVNPGDQLEVGEYGDLHITFPTQE